MSDRDALVFTNGSIATFDPTRPRAGALRLERGIVTHVADGPEGLTGQRVDLEGGVLLPGLSDAHLHLAGIGARERELDLSGTESLAEAVERVRAAMAQRPDAELLVGRGWDHNLWPGGELPTADALDRAAPGRVVRLTRVDGHASWVSRAALTRAGIGSTTPAPRGGEIVRDAAGNPSGVLVDAAMDAVEALLPAPSRAEVEAQLRAGLAAVARVGLTSVHDMGTTPRMLEILSELARTGELPVRVFAYLWAPLPDVDAALDARVDTGLLRVAGVKLFADGALGSHGALLSCPYCDRPSSSGLALTEPEELCQVARHVHERGQAVAIHAIGDLAVRRALDAIAFARGAEGVRRHRVEHAQIVAPADLPRFAALGAVASVQPTHATSDASFAEARLGAERLGWAYRARSFVESGALLAFGSDSPIEHENPWRGVAAAVGRKSRTGEPFLATEALDVEQALDGFIQGPRRALGEPPIRLVPGASPDLCLVDRDPLQTPPDELALIRARGTWVQGATAAGRR